MAKEKEVDLPPPPRGKTLAEKEAELAIQKIVSEENILSEKDEHGKPINVVAIRDGFYMNRRVKVGDKFTIEHGKHRGEWMRKI